MMNNKLLTISVAAYNVEKYLGQALESLADPACLDRIEVFVVDDGGTDGSYAIAKSYEDSYPDTFHAVHKENGGYGSTVNYSLSHAGGKYFKLLDGDDWYDSEGLKKALDILENCDEDIIIADYVTGSEECGFKVFEEGHHIPETMNAADYRTDKPHGMWSMIIKTDILRACKLQLPEHTLYTDMIYSTMPFAYAKTIRFLDFPIYCYRLGRDEQSTSMASKRKHAREWFEVCEIIYDFYDKYGKDNAYLLTRVTRYYVLAIKLLLLFPASSKNRRRIIRYENRMKKKHPQIYDQIDTRKNLGRFILLMRKTNYISYWLRLFLPDKLFV